MKILSALLLVLMFQDLIYGADTSIPSPDGKFVAVISQKSELETSILTIRSSDGSLLFTFDPDVWKIPTGNALWSPDCKSIAVAGGSPYLKKSFILTYSNERFVCVEIPYIAGESDNAFIMPLKWIEGNRLILEISGPHAGHGDYWFKGRATVRLEGSPPKCQVLYQYINSGHYKEDK